jgi:hypothetical protein
MFRSSLIASVAGLVVSVVTVAPAWSHHSFAMYDLTKTRTVTGRLVRYIPGSNHAQLVFDVLGADGKPVMENGKPSQWGVETGSAAALARQGVTPTTFPVGTVFTVAVHPLRDGRPFGAIAGLLIKCGMAVPAGGCTKETGQTLISGGGPD